MFNLNLLYNCLSAQRARIKWGTFLCVCLVALSSLLGTLKFYATYADLIVLDLQHDI